MCQEINLWTYWQGRDYAKKTPHIKYMLIGQDFGPSEKEEIKGTIANVRKMNDGMDVMFHENVDLEARDSQTDKNIVRYFELLGKNKIDKKKYGTIGKYLSIDSNYKNHNIEWSMEEDRLVFNGTFKKGSDVKIILYNSLVSNVYNVSVSKKPYTALCVDVFTDTEKENGINVTKYINKDGLKGEYSIYLSIDGKIYNTNKYIKF